MPTGPAAAGPVGAVGTRCPWARSDGYGTQWLPEAVIMTCNWMLAEK